MKTFLSHDTTSRFVYYKILIQVTRYREMILISFKNWFSNVFHLMIVTKQQFLSQLSHRESPMHIQRRLSYISLQWHHNGRDSVSITSLASVYSTVYSGADQRKHESSALLAFVWWIHRRPVNSPHKGPVTRKMFPFDDVIMSFVGSATFRREKCWLQNGDHFVHACMC